MTRTLFCCLVVLAALLQLNARADDARPAPIVGLHHDAHVDHWGTYWPKAPIRAGKWQLANIRIGMLDEFASYEASRVRAPIDAPVSLAFDDMTSPLISVRANQARSRTHWVPVAAYAIGGTHIAFAATDRVVGNIRFEGTATPALARAQQADREIDDVVLRGTLTVGGHTFADVAFTWAGFGD